MVLGVALLFVLADEPRTAWYLEDDERKMLVARLQKQVGFHEESRRNISLELGMYSCTLSNHILQMLNG